MGYPSSSYVTLAWSHALCDGPSMMAFLSRWAAACRGQKLEMYHPGPFDPLSQKEAERLRGVFESEVAGPALSPRNTFVFRRCFFSRSRLEGYGMSLLGVQGSDVVASLLCLDLAKICGVEVRLFLHAGHAPPSPEPAGLRRELCSPERTAGSRRPDLGSPRWRSGLPAARRVWPVAFECENFAGGAAGPAVLPSGAREIFSGERLREPGRQRHQPARSCLQLRFETPSSVHIGGCAEQLRGTRLGGVLQFRHSQERAEPCL